jgi:hypothetical protein
MCRVERMGRMGEKRKRGFPFFRTPSSLPFVPFSLFSPFSRYKSAKSYCVAKSNGKRKQIPKSPIGRAVARAMKTRAPVRAERKKNQPDSTHRGIFLTGRVTG